MQTSDYLTQLQNDKEALVTNLNTKGVQVSNNETFTSLIPKVLDIPSGGGSGEYNAKIKTQIDSSASALTQLIVKLPNFKAPSTKNIANYFTNTNNMYSGLLSLGEIDCSDVTETTALAGKVMPNLEDFGGFIDIGKSFESNKAVGVLNMENLTHQSLINILNGVYDITLLGYSGFQLIIQANNIAKLTVSEIAIATNKGWTVS